MERNYVTVTLCIQYDTIRYDTGSYFNVRSTADKKEKN